MTKTLQELNSQITDHLKDCNKELEFKHNDDSFSFNVLDGKGTGKGYRYTHHQNKEKVTVPLDNKLPDETFDKTVSAASFEYDTYLYLSSNPMDIPIAHAIGCNYLIVHNNAILSDYEKQLSSIDVCLTTKSEADIETLRKIFEFNMNIIILDPKELCPKYSKKDSLYTLANKIQTKDKNGIDAINKYMHQIYKKHTRETIGKISEDIKPHNFTKTTNNKSSAGLKNNAAEIDFSATQENKTLLPISKLINDKKYQSRVCEDQSAIDDLTTAYINNEEIPPITVVNIEEDKYIITDGHHRYAGAKRAGVKNIACNVIKGTELDAFELSLGANESNKALKRTNADKRNAVETALDSKEFADSTNRQIATICKVSSTFVDNIVKKRKESGETVQESANVCTQEKSYIATNTEKIISTHHKDAVINIPKPTTSSKTKAFREKVTNDQISLSVTWKSKPLSGETVQGLLTDLQGIIDDYISDFKEAI